jgi:pilus assembly protein CpaB
MKAKALIIAIATAGIGVGLLFLYMRQFEAQLSGGGTVQVVTAIKDIELGTKVTPEMIGPADIPIAYKTTRHVEFSDANRILGVPVRSDIRSNDHLLWSDLATSSEHSRDLSGLIADGMRAVTIGTSGGAFGGMLKPGDRVDILLTVHGENLAPRTLSVLQNLMVIAVGADTGGGSSDAEAQTSVTFAVTVEQSQLLTFSGTLGSLSLTLRNPDDIQVIDDLKDTSIEDVIDALRRNSVQQTRRPTPRPSGGGGGGGPVKL